MLSSIELQYYILHFGFPDFREKNYTQAVTPGRRVGGRGLSLYLAISEAQASPVHTYGQDRLKYEGSDEAVRSLGGGGKVTSLEFFER
jgi:hypothetical protein